MGWSESWKWIPALFCGCNRTHDEIPWNLGSWLALRPRLQDGRRSGALHPYSSSVLLSLEQSPAIRMKLKADVMFGVLAARLWKLCQVQLMFFWIDFTLVWLASEYESICNRKASLKSTCWEWWLQLRTFARFCVDVSINVFAHTQYDPHIRHLQ